jgi:hypothetical protein
LLTEEVVLAVDIPSIPRLSPSQNSFVNWDLSSNPPQRPTNPEEYLISSSSPSFFIPLKTDPPIWFLFRHPLITLYHSTHPCQLEFLLPSTTITINGRSLQFNENGRILKFEIYLHRKQIHQILSLSGPSPILHYLDCAKIVGNAIMPEPVNWHFFVDSIFTTDLLFSFAFLKARPDSALMAHWANAAETDFQKLFDRLLKWSLSQMSKLRTFLPPESFLFQACAAVLKADLKFRALTSQVLAKPGQMKKTFLTVFTDPHLGGSTMLLLFVIKKEQLSVFNAHKLGPVLIKAGIANIAEKGKQVDQDLLEFADEKTGFFDQFGTFPTKLRSPIMSTSHIEAYAKVFEFALRHKKDLRRAIHEVIKQ